MTEETVASSQQPAASEGGSWRDIKLADGTTIGELAVEPAATFAPATWGDLRGYQWADSGTGDMTPPYPIVRLASGQSRMEGAAQHVGQWYHSDRAAYSEVLDVVLMKRTRTRALFGRESDIPLCSSANGISPKPGAKLWLQPAFETKAGQVIDVPGAKAPDECRACPFSGGEEEDGSWRSGLCRSSLVYLAMRWDDESAAIVRLTATQAGFLERFIRQRILGRGLPLLAMRLWLKPERRQEKGRDPYYVIRVDGEDIDALLAFELDGRLRAETERFEQSMALTTDEDGRAVDTRTGEVIEP